MAKQAQSFRPARWGFTLVELLIVLVVLAIVAALALPSAESTITSKLIGAARMVAADLEFAQSDSIAHAADPRVFRIDQANDQYWIAPVSDVNSPIDDPGSRSAFRITFGEGKASAMSGITISSYDFAGDDELRFDRFGSPDQTTVATLELSCAGRTMTISVAPQTGEVSVQ